MKQFVAYCVTNVNRMLFNYYYNKLLTMMMWVSIFIIRKQQHNKGLAT